MSLALFQHLACTCKSKWALPFLTTSMHARSGSKTAMHTLHPDSRLKAQCWPLMLQDYHARQVLQHANEVWYPQSPHSGLALSAAAAPQQPER